jgi:hypothetical protein
MKINYEKLWLCFSKSNIPTVKTIEKCELRYRKDCGICYFLAELIIIPDETAGNTITIDLPEIVDIFDDRETTILATKIENDDLVDTNIRIYLGPNPGRLILKTYQFVPNARYEINFQFFMCLLDACYMAPTEEDTIIVHV